MHSRTVASRKLHATPAVQKVTFPECAKVPEVTTATLGGPNGLTHTANNLNRREKIEVLFHAGQKPSHPYQVTLELEGGAITMEIDTGASGSLISEELQKTVFPITHLTKPSLTLCTYTSEPIPLVGQMTVKMKYVGYVGETGSSTFAWTGPTSRCCPWRVVHLP